MTKKILVGSEAEELLRKHLSYDHNLLVIMRDPSLSVVEKARRLHDRWSRSAVQGGWEYGLVRDFDNKRDPRLQPFDTMSEEDQRIFYDIAASMHDMSSMN